MDDTAVGGGVPPYQAKRLSWRPLKATVSPFENATSQDRYLRARYLHTNKTANIKTPGEDLGDIRSSQRRPFRRRNWHCCCCGGTEL